MPRLACRLTARSSGALGVGVDRPAGALTALSPTGRQPLAHGGVGATGWRPLMSQQSTAEWHWVALRVWGHSG